MEKGKIIHANIFFFIFLFVAFVEDNATMSSIWYFQNHVWLEVCAKPKEVNPSRLNFSMTNNGLDGTQIYNLQWNITIIIL